MKNNKKTVLKLALMPLLLLIGHANAQIALSNSQTPINNAEKSRQQMNYIKQELITRPVAYKIEATPVAITQRIASTSGSDDSVTTSCASACGAVGAPQTMNQNYYTYGAGSTTKPSTPGIISDPISTTPIANETQ